MKKNNKSSTIVSVLIIVGVMILGLFAMKDKQEHEALLQSESVGSPQESLLAISGNVQDLVSFSVPSGATVSGPLAVNGSVQNAYFFEANIRVNILDANKNMLKEGHGTATSEWMTTDPVSFTANIDFTGLQSGNGFIQIMNDNPSGDPTKDKSIYIPVVIQ